MALDERDQTRWVVDLGGGDTFVAERTAAGLVAMSFPTRREVIVNREAGAEMQRVLGVAFGLEDGRS
jgi:hypothetical protein